MINNNFLNELNSILPKDSISLGETASSHTSFKVGGAIDVLVTPENSNEIIDIINACKEFDIPYYILGNGSNVVISDKGYRGVIIKITGKMGDATIDGNVITAQSGITLSKLSNLALNNNLSGLEFASGIPGTLGGAVFMNAGAYDGEMKNVIVSTKYINSSGDIQEIPASEQDLSYRHSIFQENGGIILETVLSLNAGNYDDIKEKMDKFNKARKEKQPLELPSAGSAFKRPEGSYAGMLIEQSGLKGKTIGGAAISQKHSGFIVNIGNATAQDIKDLVEYTRNEVYSKFDIMLEPEIRFLGEF